MSSRELEVVVPPGASAAVASRAPPGTPQGTRFPPARATGAVAAFLNGVATVRLEWSVMADSTLTPARLWKRMTGEQRLRAARALWNDADARAEQVQAAGVIAQQLKFRPKTVAGLDSDKKARYLTNVANVSDELAAKLLVTYHLAEQRPMMSAFLDALGVAHEAGLIKDDAAAPDPTLMAGAAAAIATSYPAEDVALYLNTLLWQDPATWSALSDLPESRLA